MIRTAGTMAKEWENDYGAYASLALLRTVYADEVHYLKLNWFKGIISKKGKRENESHTYLLTYLTTFIF